MYTSRIWRAPVAKNDVLGCKLVKVESHVGKEHGALVQILTHCDNSGSLPLSSSTS